MSDYVFPQFDDYDDPQNFAFHLGQSNLGDFVEYGLSLTAAHANEQFDVSEGKAYVLATDGIGDASGETRHRLVYAVHVDATAGVGFATTSGVNYVWLDANLGSQDSPQIVVETNDAAPSDASLKLGSIDAANDTAAVEANREPTGVFGADSGPGLSVASGDLRIPTGRSLEDGSGTTRFGIDSTTGTSLRDGDGNVAMGASAGNNVRIRARSGIPIQLYDQQGSFTGVEYRSSSSAPGTLALPNSILNHQYREISPPLSENNDQALYEIDNVWSNKGKEKVRNIVGADSSSLTPIMNVERNGLVVVTGASGDFPGDPRFLDVLSCLRTSFIALSKNAENGAASRTYNMNDGALELQMGASGYSVQVRSLGTVNFSGGLS